MVTPSLTQFSVTPGVIDLSWGMPDPTLLPVEQLRTAANRALDRYGPAALAYGNPQGPAPLIEFITHRLAQTDARPPTPQEVLVTSGDLPPRPPHPPRPRCRTSSPSRRPKDCPDLAAAARLLTP
jgi:DNA-binding transcriptional MocR family regulator